MGSSPGMAVVIAQWMAFSLALIAALARSISVCNAPQVLFNFIKMASNEPEGGRGCDADHHDKELFPVSHFRWSAKSRSQSQAAFR